MRRATSELVFAVCTGQKEKTTTRALVNCALLRLDCALRSVWFSFVVPSVQRVKVCDQTKMLINMDEESIFDRRVFCCALRVNNLG